jgi:periplasmic divalent cation tolerance protein
MAEPDTRVVLVTAPDVAVAESLVRTLVDERLAACGNILASVLSIYRWQGQVHREEEVLILLKTRAERIPELLRRVPELHPYEVPEVLALPVLAGHGPYIDWVHQESGPES